MGWVVWGWNLCLDEIFQIPSTLALSPTQPPDDGYWLYFPGVKWPGPGVDLCSAEA